MITLKKCGRFGRTNLLTYVVAARTFFRNLRPKLKKSVGVHAHSPHLDPGLGQVYLQGQLLPRVDVRIVRLCKHPLQLFELRAGERGPDAPLLPLLIQTGWIREKLVGN